MGNCAEGVQGNGHGLGSQPRDRLRLPEEFLVHGAVEHRAKINVGIAVDTERGLVVPAVQDAELFGWLRGLYPYSVIV